MEDKEMHSTCFTCGQSWETGTDGRHSCTARLHKKNAELKEELEKCSAEIADKETIIYELFNNPKPQVKICISCGNYFHCADIAGECCEKCI